MGEVREEKTTGEIFPMEKKPRTFFLTANLFEQIESDFYPL
jgi:hypothetical protein